MVCFKKENPYQLVKSYSTNQQLIELLQKVGEKGNSSEKIFKVKCVVSPLLNNQGSSPCYPFEEGTIVRQSKGKSYGVVERVREGDIEPITIAWWRRGQEDIPWWHKQFKGRKKEFVDEQIKYPLDYMRPLKIEPVVEFIPERTFLRMKAGTSVILEDGEIVQLGNNDVFFLSKKETEWYHLVRPGEQWIFPCQFLPGESIGYIIESPTRAQLEAARYTSIREICLLAKLFLNGIKLDKLLEKIKQGNNPGNDLKTAFKASEGMKERDCSSSDFETAWEEAYEKLIESTKHSVGIWDYKIGDRVVYTQEYPAYIRGKYQTQYDYLHGRIKDLDVRPNKPTLIIEWESREEKACHIEELKSNPISKINLIKVSEAVSYEVSEDEKYYKAFIGFRTKKLAKSWWRKLKKELGWIGDPIEATDQYNPTGWKYYCVSSKPKQKTLKGRLKHLETVSRWDFSQPGSKPNHL